MASDCLCRDVRGGQFRHTGCGCQPNKVGVILSYQSAGINTSCMECLPRLVSTSTKSSLESLGTCFMIYESWHQRFLKKTPSRKIPFVPNSSFFNTLLNWSGLTVDRDWDSAGGKKNLERPLPDLRKDSE